MPAIAPLIIFLALPILEIATFIYVGQWIGALKTIGLVVLTAIIGVAMLRYQGLEALRRVNRDLKRARPPADGIVDGFMIVIASLLLIVPGFLTDLFGLLLLVPPVRRLVWRWWSRNLSVRTYTAYGRTERRDDPFYDLPQEDYRRQDDDTKPDPRLHKPD